MSTSERVRRPEFGDCIQIGVVVRDLDRTTRGLSEVFGIGPWRTIVYPPEDRDDIETTYRGRPGQFRYRQAFADLGSVELEIIQPLEGESIWSDFLAEHGEGIHHIRFNVPGIQSVLGYLAGQDIGVTMSGSGLRPGTFWANLDTQARVGFTIELMEPVPGTDGRTPEIAGGKVRP
jgi:hypothetical protein